MSAFSIFTSFCNSKLLILPEINVVVNVEPIKPNLVMNVKGKSISIPLQAWTGSEGSRRLRLPDFRTIDT